MTYGEIITRVKRRPGLNRVPEAFCETVANQIYYDICMECPEVTSVVRENDLKYTTVADQYSVVLTDPVSQIYSVYLYASGTGANILLNGTTLASLNNDNPGWVYESSGTPAQWFTAYTHDKDEPYAKQSVFLYPAPASVATYNQIGIVASRPSNAASASYIAVASTVPEVLLPGACIEAGMAWRLARIANPQAAHIYQAEYIMEISKLKRMLVTFSDRLKEGTLQNARSM